MRSRCSMAIRHIIIGRVLIIHYTIYIIHYRVAQVTMSLSAVAHSLHHQRLVIIVIHCTCGCSYSASK